MGFSEFFAYALAESFEKGAAAADENILHH
jgi:hypothetical protein